MKRPRQKYVVLIRPALDPPDWWPKGPRRASVGILRHRFLRWAFLDGNGGWSVKETLLTEKRAREAQAAWVLENDQRLWDVMIGVRPVTPKSG